jgi:hypothetical protein
MPQKLAALCHALLKFSQGSYATHEILNSVLERGFALEQFSSSFRMQD